MKTFTAILLNIVYPGAGYLYLRDPERRIIAKFLIFVWSFFILAVAYELVKSYITGNFHAFNSPMEVPGVAWFMWGIMSIDTYFLAKKLENKQPSRKN